METYRLLITDLTNYGALRCVAGFDLDRRAMIRPEPAPATFWPSAATAPNAPFFPGNIVSFGAVLPSPKTDLPHLNEDRVVTTDVKLLKSLDPKEFRRLLNEIESPLLDRFLGNIQISNGKGFIPARCDCPSLVGARVPSADVHFFDGDKNGRAVPRLVLRTAIGSLDMSITSTAIKEIHAAGGTPAIKQALSNAEALNIRLGLARAFEGMPDRCYVQANGIYLS